MQAFVPRGLQGDVPEKVLKAVEDLAVGHLQKASKGPFGSQGLRHRTHPGGGGGENRRSPIKNK